MQKIIYGLILMMLTVGFPGITQAQESFSRDLKLSKKEKKEARRAELYANYLAIDTLLQRKTFVLEADFLQNKYGNEVPVSSTINFIKVESQHVVLQTGSNSAMGYNGVGGVTAEGNITNWRVNKDDKNLTYMVSFTTTTNVGTYDIILRIGADTNAMATITGFSRGRLTYRGNLVAPYNSITYKGYRSI